MSPSPGGHYVNFVYCRFTESENSLSICTPTETNPSPTRPLCDVVSLHRENTKNAFYHFSGAV